MSELRLPGVGKRRQTAIKRKLGELEEAQEAHAVLLLMKQTIRESDNTSVHQLLNRIQSNAHIKDIQDFLKHRIPRSELELQETQRQLSEAQSTDPEARQARRRQVLDLHRLWDEPIYRAPAKPWTNATDDGDIVSHLISLLVEWCRLGGDIPHCCYTDRMVPCGSSARCPGLPVSVTCSCWFLSI